MFKKECGDTAKSLGIGLVSIFIVYFIINFIGLQLTGNPNKILFSDLLYSSIEVFFLLIVAFLGSGIFGEEKKLGSFEYLFSLKYSRLQLLRNKFFPRLIAVAIILIIYLGIVGMAGELLLLNPSLFIPLLFSIFLFFASLSLVHENNILSAIYNFIGLMIILTFIYISVDLYFNLFVVNLNVVYNKVPYIKINMFAANIFTFLSICLFSVFILSFKNIDLATRNFKFMKKNLFRMGVIFGSVLVLITLVNQFDSSKDPKAFTEKNLLPASFSVDNGFYRFLTLFAPADVDIRSEKIIQKYRSLFDPQLKKKNDLKVWNHQAFTMMSKPSSNIYYQHFKSKRFNWVVWSEWDLDKSFRTVILSEQKSIKFLTTELASLLIRYQDLVNASTFDDFSTPSDEKYFLKHSVWLSYIARIYAFKKMLDCFEGDWYQGMEALLQQLQFHKKVIKGSRSIVTNRMAKKSMQITLFAISDLMNHKKCPVEIYQRVYEGMPDLIYEFYGTKNALIADYLSFNDYMQKGVKEKTGNGLTYFLYQLFLQENRTRNHLYKLAEDSILFEQKAPFQSQKLRDQILEGKDFNKILWWGQNPSGKKLIKERWYPNVFWGKSFFVKALYDMTKISAELRMNHHKGEDVYNTLKNLKSYKTLKDPYSGKLYKYNVKKRVIYSVGRNLVDNNGVQKTQWGKDIVLPLFLEAKSK